MGESRYRSAAGRLAFEFVIILLGVLVAFRVEGARESRQDAQQEAAQISALLADFNASRARLDTVMAQQARVVEDGRAFLAYLDGSSDALAEVGDVFSFYRFEPVLGSYRAMVSSGDATRLSNQELVNALATFAADVDAGFEDEAESSELLIEMIKVMSHLGVDILMPEGIERIGLPPKPERVPPSAYADPAFEGLLAFRIVLEANRSIYYEELSAQINNVIQLLRFETSEF